MKFKFAILSLLLTQNIFATCNKINIEKKVNEVCASLLEKGSSVKENWPKDLIYNNCGDNYVWVQDTSPEIKMIMHPIKQKMNGEVIGNQKDDNNFKLFAEFEKAAKSKVDGAWVEYLWAKPGQEKAKKKISFVKICKLKTGENWLVGSGAWKEDLN